MTRKKAPEARRMPGVKSPHTGSKFDFLNDAIAKYAILLDNNETRAKKTQFFDQQTTRWAEAFGVGRPFEEQAATYDPHAGNDLLQEERDHWLAKYRQASPGHVARRLHSPSLEF
jgi:hypothetical protein